MNAHPTPRVLATVLGTLAACVCSVGWAQSAATAPVPARTNAANTPPATAHLNAAEMARKAADACEKTVAETVRTIRDQKQIEVQFIGNQRSLTPTQTDETSVKGEGRYRAPGGRLTPFNYTCSFNTKTGETSGVVFKEKGVAPSASVEPAWQPDLNKVSPEICETSVAAAVKRKHPRVERIALDTSSRQLTQGSEGRTQLRGQGAVVPAPGMLAAAMTYRCEFDGRTGRLVDTQISE